MCVTVGTEKLAQNARAVTSKALGSVHGCSKKLPACPYLPQPHEEIVWGFSRHLRVSVSRRHSKCVAETPLPELGRPGQ